MLVGDGTILKCRQSQKSKLGAFSILASRLRCEATEHGAGKSLRSLLGDEIAKIKSASPKVLVGINNIYGWSPSVNGIFLNPLEALSAVS